MIDEPPPPTPGTITQVPEEELATERAQGDACSPAANIVTATLDTWTNLASNQNWVQVTLTGNGTYQIYAEKFEEGTAKIDFVCGPDELEIGSTRADPGTGLGNFDASLNFFTPSVAGLHYVKITTTGSEARGCSCRTCLLLRSNLSWTSGTLRRGPSGPPLTLTR